MKRSMRGAVLIGFTLFVVLPVLSSLFTIQSHNFSKFGKDSPADFNSFLNSCTGIERIQMLQALWDFSSKYNTMKTGSVMSALRTGQLDASSISCGAVRKALVWRSYNKATYYFRNDDEVDYHEIVQWAAGKVGVSENKIETLSTYQLEKEVSQKFFSKVWDSLTPQQRETIINDLNLKRAWTLDLMDTAQKVYDLITDPRALVMSILGSTVGYAFAESDTVCMFIMTVSMIKSK